jgi:hypothetical protein
MKKRKARGRPMRNAALNPAGRRAVGALCALFIAASVYSAVLAAVHSNHGPDSGGCAVCEQAAAAQSLLQSLDADARCAAVSLGAVYIIISNLRSVSEWTRLQTLTALKIQQNR